MIKRWNRGRQRPFCIIKVFLFCCIISAAAWIESPPKVVNVRDDRRLRFTRLQAKSKNEDKPSKLEGFARFFDSKKSKKEEEEKETKSQGLFMSFTKWRESRKIKQEAFDAGKFFSDRFNVTYTFPKYQEEEPKQTSRLSYAQKFVSDVIEKQKQRTREEWVVVASKTSIAPGALVPVTAGGLDLLLVASKDGSALHCVANSCPHLGTPLELGILERLPIETSETSATTNSTTNTQLGETYISKLLAQDGCEDCIVCPLHKTAFALESGEVRGVSILGTHFSLIL